MEKYKTTKGRKGQKGSAVQYDIAFKRQLARQYHEGNQSLRQLSQFYDISVGSIGRWVQEFSCELAEKQEIVISAMTEQEQQDNELLRQQNQALKASLEHERMKNFALETMLDLAKEELGVDIRKNSGAKQPKE